MPKAKKISIKEFREKGYLQELNRRFLHPLGLALQVEVNSKTGEETLDGIWDYRDDPEGIVFGDHTVSRPIFAKKAESVEKEMQAKRESRMKALGFFIQPVKLKGENARWKAKN